MYRDLEPTCIKFDFTNSLRSGHLMYTPLQKYMYIIYMYIYEMNVKCRCVCINLILAWLL